jgi:hypothetical protein
MPADLPPLVVALARQLRLRCPACGYDLRSISGTLCPECGTAPTLTLVPPGVDGRGPMLVAILLAIGPAVRTLLDCLWWIPELPGYLAQPGFPYELKVKTIVGYSVATVIFLSTAGCSALLGLALIRRRLSRRALVSMLVLAGCSMSIESAWWIAQWFRVV